MDQAVVFVFACTWPFVWPPALAMAPALCPRPRPLICIYRSCPPPPPPSTPICIYRYWPQFFVYRLWPHICLLALPPNLYFPTPVYNFYYQSGVWVCIYRPCLPNFHLLALAYVFYYRSGAWIFIYLIIGIISSGSSNTRISSDFSGIDNTNITMPIKRVRTQAAR